MKKTYTTKTKKDVVAWATQYGNAEAERKFKCSAISVARWKQQYGGTNPKPTASAQNWTAGNIAIAPTLEKDTEITRLELENRKLKKFILDGILRSVV